jgi:hypothetical protein
MQASPPLVLLVVDELDDATVVVIPLLDELTVTVCEPPLPLPPVLL